ncbi:MAG: hypothetical protein HY078_16355 [Elusimicrobia bacterium]|nr:hypothetical protein [Elusimicrobiota bacterium]
MAPDPPPTPADFQELPAAEPPNLQDILAASIKAPFLPEQTFGALRDLPEPGYGPLLVNLLFWKFAGTAMYLLFAERAVGLLAWPIGAVLFTAATLVGGLVFGFVAAAVLHVLAMLSGGRNSFARTYQIVSLLSALTPLCVAAGLAVPMGDKLGLAYGLYLAVRAISIMHFAPVYQAGIVLGAAAALLVGAQVMVRRQYSQFMMSAAMNALPTPGPCAPSEPGCAGGFKLPNGAGAVDMRQVQQAVQAAQALAGAQGGNGMSSSLDLIRQLSQSGQLPQGLPAGMAAGQSIGGQPPSPDQMRQAQTNAFAMMDNFAKAASDPKMTQALTPQQKAQLQQLMQMNAQLSNAFQAQGQAGGLSDEQSQQMSQQLQAIMRGMQSPQGSPAPADPQR